MESGIRFTVVVCLMLALDATDVTSQGHGLDKRSDDSIPTVVLQQLSQDVSLLKAQVQALQTAAGQRAAFLVNTGVHPLNVTASRPIVFPGVAFNIGHGYEPTFGYFTPPFPGVYILTMQIYPYLSTDHYVDLVRNGASMLRMRLYDQAAETSEASSVVVHAGPGDKFWVQINHDTLLHSTVHCFFSGALISPDA